MAGGARVSAAEDMEDVKSRNGDRDGPNQEEAPVGPAGVWPGIGAVDMDRAPERDVCDGSGRKGVFWLGVLCMDRRGDMPVRGVF